MRVLVIWGKAKEQGLHRIGEVQGHDVSGFCFVVCALECGLAKEGNRH